MEPVPCDLGALITEVAGNHREVNTSYEITADVERLPDLFTADPKLLRQVVSNLISNAVKYSPEGSHVRIEAGACDDGGVEIAVTDQGVGIPAAELEKLFERFFRASTSVGIAGTGIGLHMVKALVDMHHGRTDVTSEEGTGTTFTVYLPRCDVAPAATCDEDKTVKAA